MVFFDDRTKEQKRTHPVIVMGTDRFMSGWGGAQGGPSYAGWACRLDDECQVLRWVEGRGDQRRVRIVSGNYRPRPGPGHCHIYVVNDSHPALRNKSR